MGNKNKMHLYIGAGLVVFGLAPLLTGYVNDRVITQTIGALFVALGTFFVGRWYEKRK